MSRPLRIEYEGAIYHVTSRGNAQQTIYRDDDDRYHFLELLGIEVEQQRWNCYAYCLMNDHYHFIIETPEANLVSGMTRFNAMYSQWYNRRHARAGHLFQGRYKAILVEGGSYLLELCRYVVLNPVRSALAMNPENWIWSSYGATINDSQEPKWLMTKSVLAMFGDCQPNAIAKYKQFVKEGANSSSPWDELRGQVYLGSEKFMQEMSSRIKGYENLEQVSDSIIHPNRPTPEQVLTAIAETMCIARGTILDRKVRKDVFQVAIYLLRRVCNLPLKKVAAMSNISITRISQIQRKIRDAGGLGKAYSWASGLEKKYIN